MRTDIGSSEEFYWYDKILRGFRVIIMFNSTILCREYIQAFVDELHKRNDVDKINELKRLFSKKQLTEKNEMLYRLLVA
jgi:hypothetical protein